MFSQIATGKERIATLLTLAQAEQFWASVQVCAHGDPCPDCCWLWRKGRTTLHYGRYFVGSASHPQRVRAHRLAYLLTAGELPDGLHVLHRCDNPPCCNPAHLWLGTQTENMRDAFQKDRAVRGERHWKAKLTPSQVHAIRAWGLQYATTPHGAKGLLVDHLATQYGLHPSSIVAIWRGRTWRRSS